MLSSADFHVGDLDFRKVLAVSSMTAIAVPAGKPEDPHLLAFAVAHDLGGHRYAGQFRSAGLDVLAVARDEDVVEGDLVPRLRVEQRNLDRNARLGPKLGATGREDCV